MNARLPQRLAAALLCAVLAAMASVPVARAQGNATPAAAAPPPAVLFRDVRVFDGRRAALWGPVDVLVRGPTIARIAASPMAVDGAAPTTVIDCKGRTLMPGLIDNHWHTMMASTPLPVLLEADVGYLNLLAAAQAEATLMRGFTSVRDLGGPSFALKRAIDEGLVVGPRVYPSGAMISITGGHGDFRSRSDLPRQLGGPLTKLELIGGSFVADSPDEVRVRAREQLLLGASQIKLTAGGGVASPHSPLDIATFDEDELRAAVRAAGNWGTYVGVHAYTPVAIQRAIAAGIKVIEHGHLMDDASAKAIADNGLWLSFQPFVDDGHTPPLAPANLIRLQQVRTGTERTIELVKKYKLKMALGTDILFSAASAARQGEVLTTMTRWYSAPEVLTIATSTNGELLKLSGPRDPYPGKLGVVEEGALADLLLVDGNPLENLRLVEDPARNFVVIMKDGRVFKNTVAK